MLWAHAGFVGPDTVGPMLGKHANLWTDLAFRSEHAYDGLVDDDWRGLFTAFPDRVMVGTDTFTPSAGTTSSSTRNGPGNGWATCRPTSPKTSPGATVRR